MAPQKTWTIAAAILCVFLFLTSLKQGVLEPHAPLDWETIVSLCVPFLLLLGFQAESRTRPVGGGAVPYLLVLIAANKGHFIVFALLFSLLFVAFCLRGPATLRTVSQFFLVTLPLMAVTATLMFIEPSPEAGVILSILYIALAVLTQVQESKTMAARLAFQDAVWTVCFSLALSSGSLLSFLVLWGGAFYFLLPPERVREREQALSNQITVARRTLESNKSKRQLERDRFKELLLLQQNLDAYQESALKAENFQSQADSLLKALSELTESFRVAVVNEAGAILAQSEEKFPLSQFLPLPSNPEIGRLILHEDKKRFVFGLSRDLLLLGEVTGEHDEKELIIARHLLGRSTLLLQLFGQKNDLSVLLAQKSEALDKLAESQRQLVQSGKMAAVGQLAAGIAHEINSPLAAVALQSELGLRRLGKEDIAGASRCLEICKRASRRAKEIIENLLTFSRTSGEEKSQVNILTVLQESLELIQGQFDDLEVKVSVEVSPESVVLANPNDLQHIFTNIVLNAFQALKEIETNRDLSIICEEKDSLTTILFSNNGPPIPDEVAQRLYEPFFTTKDVGSGTGLGLSLAYQMCQKNGGQLRFEQNERVHFLVDLPRG